MEYLWKRPYGLMRLNYVRDDRQSSAVRFSLGIAPVVVPLAMLAIGFRTLSASLVFWIIVMVVAFAVAGLRLLLMQWRQKRTLAELHHGMELLHSEISRYRRREEQLQQAQRMESIGSFSGAIAHDFSNVLTVIKGYSQITHSGLQDRPNLQANLQQIIQAADRAAALIRQLLAFSRQQALQPRVINLNDVTSNLLQMLQRLIGADIRIGARFAGELWTVRADPNQIEQVLMNLAANARDAMPGGGKLFLETANVHLDEVYVRSNLSMVAGDYVMFSLTDTGTGMDAQTRARIFEPFFTTKAAGKGTGLGLATAYSIVKQSGGHIAVESEPGAGSTFRVYLPRVEQPINCQAQGPPRFVHENYGEASC